MQAAQARTQYGKGATQELQGKPLAEFHYPLSSWLPGIPHPAVSHAKELSILSSSFSGTSVGKGGEGGLHLQKLYQCNSRCYPLKSMRQIGSKKLKSHSRQQDSVIFLIGPPCTQIILVSNSVQHILLILYEDRKKVTSIFSKFSFQVLNYQRILFHLFCILFNLLSKQFYLTVSFLHTLQKYNFVNNTEDFP